MRVPVLLLAPVLLGGCAATSGVSQDRPQIQPPREGGGACVADGASRFVGQRVTEALSSQIIALTRRAALMEGQVEVLEGKRKTLARFRESLARHALTGDPSGPGGAFHLSDDARAPLPPAVSRIVLSAQEDLRRKKLDGFTGTNPIPEECERVLRGGAFNYDAPGLRSSNRVHHPGRFRLVMSGLRCARDVATP